MNMFRHEPRSISDLKAFFVNEIKDLKDIINRQNEFILNTLGEHTIYLKELQKKNKINNKIIERFPVTCEEDLKKLENEINESNEEEFVRALQQIIKPGEIVKHLEKAIGEEIILGHNYDGIHNKLAFKDYKKYD